MIKSNTKIGDIFSVKIDDNNKKYFQLVSFDSTQLNSDVIRAFTKNFSIDANPDLKEITNGEVGFYTHCITKVGLKMNLWEKFGNINEVGNLSNILFRGSSDSGVIVRDNPIKISHKWYIWHINDKDFTKVGKLEGEYRKAELGIVVNPYDVIERLKTGKFSFFYPGFE